jgi:hypothetical protein
MCIWWNHQIGRSCKSSIDRDLITEQGQQSGFGGNLVGPLCFFMKQRSKQKGCRGSGSPCAETLPALRGMGTGPVAQTQPAFGSFVPDCFYFSKPLLTRVTIKSLHLPHCLSKLLGFGKRVEAVRGASFLNSVKILVPVKDAKVFAITSCGYIPPELRFVPP